MAWVRDGDAPDEVKVSFVVSKADHPELVEWLWGLPFRKQSAVIRDVLSEASKMVLSEVALVSPAVTRKSTQNDVPTIAVSTKSAVEASSVTPSSSTSMTEATAAILRNMRQDF